MREYLRELREKSHINQEELAERLGISRSYYVRIERAERQENLNISIAAKLAEIFGVTVDWIAQQEKER